LCPEWAGKCKQAEEDRPPDFRVYLHGCVVVRFSWVQIFDFFRYMHDALHF
jgi:hypothetical protein